MKTFCVSCKKNTASENLSARKTKQNRLILLSNSGVCGKKKSSRSWYTRTLLSSITLFNSVLS